MNNPSRTWRRALRPRAFALYLILAFAFPQAGSAGRASVAYSKQYVCKTVVHVVTVDLNDPDVRLTPVFARRGLGTAETFHSILNRTRPTAAITGTFFDTRSLYPTGDIVVDGEMVCRGVVGTAIGIGWNNEVDFISTRRGYRSQAGIGFLEGATPGPLRPGSGHKAPKPLALRTANGPQLAGDQDRPLALA